jgi:hypothetical protein
MAEAEAGIISTRLVVCLGADSLQRIEIVHQTRVINVCLQTAAEAPTFL